MYEDVFQVSGAPRLSVLGGQGELEIRGWNEPAIKLRGRGGPKDFQVKREGDAVILHAGEDCFLLVPRGCPVVVERAEDNRTVNVGQEERAKRHSPACPQAGSLYSR